MFIFDNAIDAQTVQKYYDKISTHYLEMLSQGHNYAEWYPTRNLRITDHEVIEDIKNFLEKKIRVKLTVDEAELQTWPIGISSDPHVHDSDGRRMTDYNSLLYLNDDFERGEFFTTTGLTIKPLKNRLTFFDGRNVTHGIHAPKNKHRHTIIVWWKNSKFY